MNKIKLETSKTVPKKLELDSGDILLDQDGNLYLIANAGFYNDDMELLFRVIELETGNRWDDTVITLEDILKSIKDEKFKVYRDCEISVSLGERII